MHDRERLFEDCEAVFDRFDGRPHWGKWHSLDHEALGERYPEWETFQNVRRSVDPLGTFLNDHLERLFGAVTGRATD